jgi:hypothetical protein
MRGRPGTTALPLLEGRAVGGPIPLGLLGLYAAFALAGWLAATVALVFAAPRLAAHDVGAELPVLATHLVALGFLPLAVVGASFHLLPVMLRNDVRHPRSLRLALPLLGGAFLAAPGIALDRPALLWPGAALVAAGFALVAVELVGLIRHAPAGRTLVASRTGVSLVVLHVSAALVLGAVVFSRGDEPFAGVGHDRWVLVHLHLAVIGWLTLLIVTVGRTLAPMLASSPAAPLRRLPGEELALTAGLWTFLAGIAAASQPAELAGAAVVLLALASFGRLLAHTARTRRLELEAPLAHLLGGGLFLLQAAVLGIAIVTGAVSEETGLGAYVVLLLVGWAGGVTLGHFGKLLALSLWVWWPPGPRPKQAALYPRRIWLAEAAAFTLGVELLAAGSLTVQSTMARAGAALLVAAACIAAAGATLTWRAHW